MARRRDHVGTIYVRKGTTKLYVSIPRKVAQLLGLKKDIATGLYDSLEGRSQAKGLLMEITHKWHAAMAGEPVGGLNRATPQPGAPSQITIKEAFERFKSEHGAQRSANSQRNYVLAYNAVMHHGDEQALLSDSIQRGETKVAYVETLIEKLIKTRTTAKGQITPESCEIYARTFLIFLQWSFDQGLLPVMVVRKRLKKLHPHMAGKAIMVWTDDEISALIDYSKSDKALPAEKRMGMIIEILARTPLRIHEALTMKRGDIDQSTLTLRVQRKDGKAWEYIPLTKSDVAMLIRIADQCGATKATDPVLQYHITTMSRLRRTFLSMCTNAKVDPGGRLFHEFKKTYITRLVTRVGKDLSLHEVARLARCGVQVLERHYLSISPDTLRTKLEKMWGEEVAEGEPSE